MSDYSQPRFVEWGPGKTARGRARLPESRRRDRPQLSCSLCRHRKLRCDRQQPCGSCSHRGLGPACTYVSRPPGGVHRQPTVQERIQQLESLVVDLMQKTSVDNNGYQKRSDADTPGALESFSLHPAVDHATSISSDANIDIPEPPSPSVSDGGSLQVTSSGTNYVNSAHWAAVLDRIADLRDHFEQEEMQARHQLPDDETFIPERTGPQLLYGCMKQASKEELLAALPARPVVDRLVSRYFNSFDMSPAVLNSAQFLKEYEEFWNDPSKVPVIWLGLLYTIMCLATQFQKFRLDPTFQSSTMAPSTERDLQRMVETFRERIVQCLIHGDYAKGGPYVLETLMLYIAVELFLRSDAEIGIWILLGTIVQLAMHMGYHRDPKHFKISPFAAEMRKRVWTTVVELDLGISTQMGLPRLIKHWQTDTGEPLNLYDNDFNQATAKMPCARPETELTPMLYRLVKARMVTVIGVIWDFSTDTSRPYTYAEIMKMDSMLHDTHRSIPLCLQWHSMTHCIMDSPQIIMQKVFLEIMFHRARIMLHQGYLHSSQIKSRPSHSQQACIDAALKLLEHQHVLQEETQPFCRLYQERWRVSSLVNHDFLLATSVLCSYLQQARSSHDDADDPSLVETIWAYLQKTYDIWHCSSSSSNEARKAAKALSVVLGNRNTSCSRDSENLPPLEQLSPPPNDHTDCSQEVPLDMLTNTAGFHVQFPVFDASVLTNWHLTQEGIESLPLSTPGSGFGWPMQ